MIGLATSTGNSGSALITVTGRLVSGIEAESLRRCLAALIPEHREVAVDLSALHSLDAAGIGVLVEAWSIADGLGAHLTLRDVPGPVGALLDLTGLAGVLVETPDRLLALRAAAH